MPIYTPEPLVIHCCGYCCTAERYGHHEYCGVSASFITSPLSQDIAKLTLYSGVPNPPIAYKRITLSTYIAPSPVIIAIITSHPQFT